MKRFLRAFDGADILVVVVGLAVVGLLEINKHYPLAAMLPPALRPAPATPSPVAAVTGCPLPDPSNYAPRHFEARSKIVSANLAPIPQGLRPEFETFSAKADYFGAFAVAQNGSFGWGYGYGRLSAAIEVALDLCKGENGQNCAIAAEILPETALEIGACDETLTNSQFAIYQELVKGAGPRAFARSIDGTSTQGRGASVTEASAAALASCEKIRAENTSVSHFPCQVVQTWDR